MTPAAPRVDSAGGQETVGPDAATVWGQLVLLHDYGGCGLRILDTRNADAM
jgi:hypothetical protein